MLLATPTGACPLLTPAHADCGCALPPPMQVYLSFARVHAGCACLLPTLMQVLVILR